MRFLTIICAILVSGHMSLGEQSVTLQSIDLQSAGPYDGAFGKNFETLIETYSNYSSVELIPEAAIVNQFFHMNSISSDQLNVGALKNGYVVEGAGFSVVIDNSRRPVYMDAQIEEGNPNRVVPDSLMKIASSNPKSVKPTFLVTPQDDIICDFTLAKDQCVYRDND